MTPIQSKKVPSTAPLSPNAGAEMDAVSDAVDTINAYLGEHPDAPRPKNVEEAEDDSWKTSGSKFDAEKDKDQFRNYEDAMDSVKNFYAEQHARQTVEYNVAMREKYLGKDREVNARMTIWEAIDKLDELVDESDPDTSLTQSQHLLQTAEAMRRDGKPDWMQLTGLLHDLGKLLVFFGAKGQWDVVGDTFVVGAAFAPENVYPSTFEQNPDSVDPRYNTELGMYERGCGLENVMLSWGHDEYMYHILKGQSKIPKAGLDMVRYHSFYPWHRGGAYRQFHKADGSDDEALEATLAFNAYDLYSKSDEPPQMDELRDYYSALIDKYVPGVIEW